jgi:uncharacterized YkwD family protein/spore coat assembly protein SafA
MIKKILFLFLATAITVPVLIPDEKAEAQENDRYIVKPGDTLWKISVKYEIGLSEIINANPEIRNPALIYPNQQVKIPTIQETKSVEEQVLDLVNKERAKAGQPALKMDWQLQRVARTKSEEMRDKNYFSHTSPSYGSPFDMMKAFDIDYRTAGENIAAGQQTPKAVMNGWMNSAGHRKNILSPDFTHIGVGYAKGGSKGYYWTQQFISK